MSKEDSRIPLTEAIIQNGKFVFDGDCWLTKTGAMVVHGDCAEPIDVILIRADADRGVDEMHEMASHALTLSSLLKSVSDAGSQKPTLAIVVREHIPEK